MGAAATTGGVDTAAGVGVGAIDDTVAGAGVAGVAVGMVAVEGTESTIGAAVAVLSAAAMVDC